MAALNFLIVIGAFVLTAVVVSVANWLSLNPWRRNKDKHWSEQARLLQPAVSAARANLFIIPAICVLWVLLTWPDSSPLWIFTGIAALLGAYLATLPVSLEIFPRISFKALLKTSASGMLAQFLMWTAFFTAAIYMPADFGWLTVEIGLAVIVLAFLWSRGGWLWFGKLIGRLQPAPERLQKIAAETSASMKVPFKEVLLVRSPVAQAYAFPPGKRLLFTERILEILSDDEIAAVCAHELAHLTESRRAYYGRYIAWLRFFPWIFFNPLMNAFGVLSLYVLLFFTVMAPRISRTISLKLESRADAMAKANETNEGVYAKALLRLYEDRLTPAVHRKGRATHPSLYDRLIAAGVTPDFPRPAPPQSMAWHGRFFAVVAGLLFVVLILRNAPLFGTLFQDQ